MFPQQSMQCYLIAGGPQSTQDDNHHIEKLGSDYFTENFKLNTCFFKGQDWGSSLD